MLKAPDIPSILVETAFISNVEEERKLKTANSSRRLPSRSWPGLKPTLPMARRWREGDNKKALKSAFFMDRRYKKTPFRVFIMLVAGAGFEPTTFGL